jgi:hypothetical protein
LTDDPETPHWNTGVLWIVLAVFVVIGTVGSATVVYGLLGLVARQWIDVVPVVLGAVVAVLAFLFIAGILYRVDRYRGIEQRQVRLFE